MLKEKIHVAYTAEDGIGSPTIEALQPVSV